MNKNSTRHLRMSVWSLGALAFLASCQQGASHLDQINSHNLVVSGSKTEKTIGDSTSQFLVLGKDRLADALFQNEVLSPESPRAIEMLSKIANRSLTADPKTKVTVTDDDTSKTNDSLVLGFPIGLLHQEYVFGGVITKVSDKENPSLGMLKLADLPPVHARAEVIKDTDGTYLFALIGCAESCNETSAQKLLLGIPITSVDADKDLVLVDLATVGDGMNLVQMYDPFGFYTNLKTKSSKTISFDYSLSTLLFDVEAHMVPLSSKKTDKEEPKETIFTTRWYLKLASEFNPAFEGRPAAKGVGFFMTQRAADPKIERVARPVSDSDLADYLTVHYYVKNVPKEYKAGFAAAFDEWNEKFKDLSGKKIFSYEFVEATDSKAKLLIPGDPRYHIVEWDLDNQAPYGGLGPSMANQFSGEIFSANVLVQGPMIVTTYKKWFETSQRAEGLRLAGRSEEADALLVNAQRELRSHIKKLSGLRFQLTLTPELPFRITSQTPSLEDPLMDRVDFEPVPSGYTYEQYMTEYFHDMLAHELGHNLGLRHNFRGNLSAGDELAMGKVSSSIMEYLGKSYRYLSRIGPYDLMAIQYGYFGITPSVTNGYCTDDEVVDSTYPEKSAECSRDDATNDPFSYFEKRLAQSVDLLMAKGSKEAPSWKIADVDAELTRDVSGMLFYASSAEKKGDSWTNFFKKADRPKVTGEVKGYVLQKLKDELCNKSITEAIALKETPEAHTAVLANLGQLKTKVTSIVKDVGVFKEADLKCAE